MRFARGRGSTRAQPTRADDTLRHIQNPTRQRHAQVEMALRHKDPLLARSLVDEAEKGPAARRTRLSQAYPELDTILVALAARSTSRQAVARRGLAFIDDIQQAAVAGHGESPGAVGQRRRWTEPWP